MAGPGARAIMPATEAHARAHRPLPRAAPGPRAGARRSAAASGVLVLDASPLAAIEDEYGTPAYEEVRQRVFKILEESRGKDYRQGDILCLDRPRGLRFLFLLDRKRRRTVPLSVADLRTARQRVALLPGAEAVQGGFPVPQGGALPRRGIRSRRQQPAAPRRARDRAGDRGSPLAGRPPPPRRRAGRARAPPGHPAARARADGLPGHLPHAGRDDHGLRGPVAGAAGLRPRARPRRSSTPPKTTTSASSWTACAGGGRCSPPGAFPRTPRSS